MEMDLGLPISRDGGFVKIPVIKDTYVQPCSLCFEMHDPEYIKYLLTNKNIACYKHELYREIRMMGEAGDREDCKLQLSHLPPIKTIYYYFIISESNRAEPEVFTNWKKWDYNINKQINKQRRVYSKFYLIKMCDGYVVPFVAEDKGLFSQMRLFTRKMCEELCDANVQDPLAPISE